MDVHSVLAQLEAERQTESVTAKLYRYMGLMQTIGLFSQRLTRAQCLDIAFDSVNELVTIAHSLLYTVHEGAMQNESAEPAASDAESEQTSLAGEPAGNPVLKTDEPCLRLRKAKGVTDPPPCLALTEPMRNLALMGTGILVREKALKAVLGDETCERLRVRALIPFVNDDELEGIILLGEKAVSGFDNDDAIILEALLRLADGALENNRRLEALARMNRAMDAKVFDLFAINQATRALMSETSLESLVHLSVDVFSEVMRSSRTALFLETAESCELPLLAYLNARDTTDLPDPDCRIVACAPDALPEPMPQLADLNTDEGRALASRLFPGGAETLERIGARCLVLLERQGRLAGLVTLGERMEGGAYEQGQLEVIESLAAATLVAIENARLIEALGRQKRDLHERLERLLSLSTLIKNINASGNMETLLELTGRTLEASFSVRKGMLLLWDGEAEVFRVSRTIGFDGAGELPGTGAWEAVLNGSVVCEAGPRRLREWIPASILPDGEDVEGILIEPIQHTDIRRVVLGAIVVLAFRGSGVRDTENLLTMEAIANHLSLMIIAFDALGRQRRFRMPLHVEAFKRALRQRIAEAQERGQPFDLLQVSDQRGYIFRENNLAGRLEEHYDHVYPVAHNDVFVLPDGDGEAAADALARIFGEDEVRMRVLRFGREFSSFKEFFDLL